MARTMTGDSGAGLPDPAQLPCDNCCLLQRPGCLSPGNLSFLPRLLSEREAARTLGVSVDTLRRERKRGRIGHTFIGGRPRYTPQYLMAYVSAREVEPCKPTSDQSVRAKSASIGSADDQTALSGAGRGSILTPDKLAEHRSGLAI